MCVSHGKALEKTKIRMNITHQHSLDEMRHKVQDISFPQTPTRKWVHKLTNKQNKNQRLPHPMVKIGNKNLVKRRDTNRNGKTLIKTSMRKNNLHGQRVHQDVGK